MLIIYKPEENEDDKTLEILKSIFDVHSTNSREVEKLENGISEEKGYKNIIYTNNNITLYGIDESYILDDNIMGTASLITGFKSEIIKENNKLKLLLSPEDKSLEEKTLNKKYELIDNIKKSKFSNAKIISHLSKDDILFNENDDESLINPNYEIKDGYIKEIDNNIYVEIRFVWKKTDKYNEERKE